MEWISVYDRLPNTISLNLTLDNNGWYDCLIYDLRKTDRVPNAKWRRAGSDNCFGNNTIRYWMELPDKPK